MSSDPVTENVDENEQDEYEEEDEPQEEIIEPKILPKRSTRAQRTTAAAEGDEEFWQQEAFQDEGMDDDYEQSDVSADEPDSDFFESEQEESEEDEEAMLAKEKTKKRQGYVDPQRRKRGGNAAAARAAKRAKAEPTETDEHTPITSELSIAQPEGTPAPRQRQKRAPASPSSFTPVRKSKRSTTAERSAATQQRVQVYRSEPKIKRDKTVYRIRSQAEMMAEAARTEVWNTESLRQMLAQEEDKKRVLAVRDRYDGPTIIYLSTEKYQDIAIETITFTKSNRIPGVWNQPRPLAIAGTRLCPVNGLRPRYMDPVTNIPYDSLQTFHTIRQHTMQYSQVYNEQTQKLQNARIQELQQEYREAAQQFALDQKARDTLRPQRIQEGKAIMAANQAKAQANAAAEQAKKEKLAARETYWRTIELDSAPTYRKRKQLATSSTSTSTSSSTDLHVTTDDKQIKPSGRRTPRGRK